MINLVRSQIIIGDVDEEGCHILLVFRWIKVKREAMGTFRSWCDQFQGTARSRNDDFIFFFSKLLFVYRLDFGNKKNAKEVYQCPGFTKAYLHGSGAIRGACVIILSFLYV